jgi:hypothetical protein
MIVVRVEDEPKPQPATDGVYVSPFMVLMLAAVQHFEISEQHCPKKEELEQYFHAQKVDGKLVSKNLASQLATALKILKLPGFVHHYGDLAKEAEKGGWSFPQYLFALTELEARERDDRRIERHLRQSGLPAEKTLATLKLERLPTKVRRILPSLCDGGFVDRGDNVGLFGLGVLATYLLFRRHSVGRAGVRVAFLILLTFALVATSLWLVAPSSVVQAADRVAPRRLTLGEPGSGPPLAPPNLNRTAMARSTTVKWNDVPAGYWDRSAIDYVGKTFRWMRDYPAADDGTFPFKPDRLESRKLFASAAVMAFAPSVDVDPKITFDDLPSDSPYYRYANVAELASGGAGFG